MTGKQPASRSANGMSHRMVSLLVSFVDPRALLFERACLITVAEPGLALGRHRHDARDSVSRSEEGPVLVLRDELNGHHALDHLVHGLLRSNAGGLHGILR